MLALAVINSAGSFFKWFRYKVIVSALWSVAFLLAMTAKPAPILLAAGAVLILLVLMSFGRIGLVLFRPDVVLGYEKAVASFPEHMKTQCVLEEESNRPRELLSPEQVAKWSTKLEQAVMLNRLALFVARRLNEYRSSGIGLASSTLSFLGLSLGMILSFAGAYYALFKADPVAFDVTVEPSLFEFIYFSVNSVVHNQLAIVPVSQLAKSVWMLETVLSWLLLVVIVGLGVAFARERSSEKLERSINSVEQQGAQMEDFIREQYRMPSAEAALAELQTLKSSMIKMLLWISARVE